MLGSSHSLIKSASNRPSESLRAIPFGQLLPMIREAISQQSTWIGDFEDEEIRVSQDLYDVIEAFQSFHQK
jgi:hypothetical protein